MARKSTKKSKTKIAACNLPKVESEAEDLPIQVHKNKKGRPAGISPKVDSETEDVPNKVHKKKKGRPAGPKVESETEDVPIKVSKKKKGRPAGISPKVESETEDVPIKVSKKKKGRPAGPKVESETEDVPNKVPKKKKGRPAGPKVESETEDVPNKVHKKKKGRPAGPKVTSETEDVPIQVHKKKKGRPAHISPKVTSETEDLPIKVHKKKKGRPAGISSKVESETEDLPIQVTKKKKGRPAGISPKVESETEDLPIKVPNKKRGRPAHRMAKETSATAQIVLPRLDILPNEVIKIGGSLKERKGRVSKVVAEQKASDPKVKTDNRSEGLRNISGEESDSSVSSLEGPCKRRKGNHAARLRISSSSGSDLSSSDESRSRSRSGGRHKSPHRRSRRHRDQSSGPLGNNRTMSGLKSLLKYRFQPRESEKIENANGDTTPPKNSPDVVPETPPSKQASPGSPVFRRAKKIAAIDSSGDDSPNSKSNSPWLSKANGVKTNGGVNRTPSAKRKYESESPSPSSSSSSGATSVSTSSESRAHEMKQKVDSLKAMFPGCALWMLEDAAVATPDLEAAIDLIISRNRVGSGGKQRQQLNSQSSNASSSSDIGPPAKRARPLVSDSSDVTNTQDSQETVTSPTENMGSIKAIQAARTASRIRRDLMVTDEEDDNPEDAAAAQPRVHVKKKKNRTKMGDDDSGDDAEELELVESEDDSDAEDSEEKDADPILSFFQNAELDELITMHGCSKKKAETIIESRPYTDWADLMGKFTEQKGLSLAMVSSCKELLKIRGVVNRLMKHCEQIAQDMESIVSALTSNTTISQKDCDGYITKQPDTLETQFQLKPYQLVGLNWLTLMHRQELNGILADEMGLGKTIQTVAFLAQLLQDGEKGPHVIVAPSSIIDNWLRELRKWCPKLKVILYYGSQEERRDLRAEIMEGGDFHVIVTSYNMATGGIEDRVLFKKFKFHYAIFDEGHMLKNMTSLRYQNLMKIRAQRRLLLTGTPLQNNLVELMSLLCFVMPEMFGGKTDHLKRMFTAITSGTKSAGEKQGAYEKECVNRAKQILKPFFLRRVKSDVLKQLPLKVELLEKVPLAEPQYELYEELRVRFTKRLETAAAVDRDLKSRGASMLMELRKAANHHLLHRRHYDDSILHEMAPLMLKEPTHSTANADYIFEDMQVMSDFELHRLCTQYRSIKRYKLDEDQVTDSGKFRFLDTLLAELKQKGSRVLLFSQFTMMLDIIEVYMNERGHRFLRLDGSTPVAERQEMIDTFNNEADIFVFLLSTRAGGLGINLTAADTVVLHDIDFNPYNDKQAEDRCHRVGQTKNVSVHRLVSRNTVEEAMYRCAQKKLKLEEEVTGTGSKDTDDTGDVASLLKEALGVENTK